MFYFSWRQGQLTDAIRRAFELGKEQNAAVRTALDETLGLTKTISQLRSEVDTLTKDKSTREEAFARREREIEHRVGLHKQQVEQDIDLAKRETAISLREENLAADRRRFEEQMKFVTDNFDNQSAYLQKIIGDLAARLPSLKMTANLTEK